MSTRALKAVSVKPPAGSIIKPGELIDVVEIKALSLQDRRIYNALIANAWERITEDIEHVIPKSELAGSHDSTDRVGQCLENLMGAFARVKVIRDGERAILRVHLLSDSVEHERGDGLLYYRFTPAMREIIANSEHWGQLQRDVMYALSSKYALALYEMIQKRGRLKHRWQEEFSLADFRSFLGVDAGKLPRFADLNAWAIKPAVEEVAALSDYGVAVEPIKKARTVVGVRLSWWRKNGEEIREAFAELKRPKVGRRARIRGTVEAMTDAAL